MSSPASQAQQQPSTLALAIGFTLVGGIAGFFLGQAAAVGVFGSSGSKSRTKSRRKSSTASGDGKNRKTSTAEADGKASAGDDEASGSETEDEDVEDSDDDQDGLKGFEDEGVECKLVLVVRSDLGMTKGKIAAQCGHATLACYRTLSNSDSGQSILRRWERYGQAKVAVKTNSEEDLMLLQAQAVSLGVCARVIHDAGRTQIEAGSATVLGVGPAPKGVVDAVTGGLKLL
ncbi:MAG: hypothetical protein Q9162_006247 [Coniocarpon cinnabarinum]